MQGDAEDPDEASALLAQAAKFPPGSLQRRFTLHYWRHPGLLPDAPKEAPAPHQAGPTEGQEQRERPRGLHQYLYHHPNGLFIVGLAKENAALEACRQSNGGVTITRVEFLPDNNKPAAGPAGKGKGGGGGGGGGGAGDTPATAADATSAIMKSARVTSRGRGKKQKGSLHVRRDTVLARVVLSDGREFPVFGGVVGQVVELNEVLSKDPGLLLRQPEHHGFIAIVQPKRFATIPPDLSHLITPEAYHEAEQEEKGEQTTEKAGDGMA